MGFASGSISFKRYQIVGQVPHAVDEKLLEKLSANALRPSEIGVPEEIEYGWSGGRHLFDASFSFEHNFFNDALVFALRVDTNKVSGDIKKAYQLMEEEAAAATNPSGFISKVQKKDVKDVVRRRVDDELRTGRYRKSKLLPLMWDVPAGVIYCNASQAAQEKLLELFERTFDLSLKPLSAGSIALNLLEGQAKRRDYEDCRPTRFAVGPEGESQFPDYPWVAKGPEPKDFLGNEFLLWLWHEADGRGNGMVNVGDGADVAVMFDKSLDLDCAYGQTGRDSLRGAGPTVMPEAIDALRVGKLPRKAGLTIDNNGGPTSFTLNAETFGVGGLRLPEVEDADSPRVLFEERVTMLRDFCGTLDKLFAAFLDARLGGSWESKSSALRRWVMKSARTVNAVEAIAA